MYQGKISKGRKLATERMNFQIIGNGLQKDVMVTISLEVINKRLKDIKSLPAMQETWIRSLDWEDPLEKEIATRSSILAWRSAWTEEPGRLKSMGSQRVGHD